MKARQERWLQTARPEQLPPDGDWSTWYVRGGRGAGKTRTGAETLATWLLAYPGDYAVIAPTYGAAKRVCIESTRSGLLKVLGGYPGGLVKNWNRSEGIVYLENGSTVFCDGADDGAYRIQGENLNGAWCDEVGLWVQWDKAWRESLEPAIRFEPARVIATGTPKMGHRLIAYLMDEETPNIVRTHMRTIDNIDNLHEAGVTTRIAEYEGTMLGRQEYEGEFIAALEGEILHRSDWRYYPAAWSFYAAGDPKYANLPRFSQIVHSWDTAVKDKTTADYYAGQVWGIGGDHPADRHLLRIWHEHSGFEQAKQAMRELVNWSLGIWDHCPTRIIVEAAGIGPDIVKQLEREIQGLRTVAPKGDKVQRAWAASPALESHNCFLPGQPLPDLTNYEPTQTPTKVQAFVDECALFRGDMKHAHDDQVDAWSQMVNWVRGHAGKGSTSVPSGRIMAGVR